VAGVSQGSRYLYGSECWDGKNWGPLKWLRGIEEDAMQYMAKGKAIPGQGPYLELCKRYTKQKLKWLGHVLRMESERMVRQLTIKRGRDVFCDVLPEGDWECMVGNYEEGKNKTRLAWGTYVGKTVKKTFGVPYNGPIQVQKERMKYFMYHRRVHAYREYAQP